MNVEPLRYLAADWETFWRHERDIRINLDKYANTPLHRLSRSLWNEFLALTDKRAYAECIRDVASARKRVEETLGPARLALASPAANTLVPRAIRALGQLDLALRRFTRVQKTKRGNQVPNASKTSRNFTKALIVETRRELALLNEAREREQHPQQNDQDRAPGPANIAPPVAANTPQNPQQDDHDRATGSANDVPPVTANTLQQVADAENNLPEHAPGSEGYFRHRWEEFLNGVDAEDLAMWQYLHEKAQGIFNELGKSLFPVDGSISINAWGELRTRINKASRPIISLEWDRYIFDVRGRGYASLNDEVLLAARNGKDEDLGRVEKGQSPICPPANLPPPVREQRDSSVQEQRDSPSYELVARRSAAENAVEIGFDGESTGIQGTWRYLSTIGLGGQGQVGLWIMNELQDSHLLVKRIAVKELYPPEDCQDWNARVWWINDAFTSDADMLREPAIHSRLARAGSSAIVGYRGSNFYEDQLLLRIYMDFCAHGDLLNLLFQHAGKDEYEQNRYRDDGRLDYLPVPNRALWMFFKDLSDAACIMEAGSLSNQPPTEGWRTIVHRDIKPNNIFLGSSGSEGQGGIPFLKLGDFGLAVPEDWESRHNPRGMNEAGTRGWKAPEQCRYDENIPLHKLTSATNIWAIGRVMLKLLELTTPKPTVIQYNNADGGVVFPEPLNEELMQDWDQDLTRLLQACLSPQPNDRITADQLNQDINLYIRRHFSEEDDNGEVSISRILKEGEELRYRPDMQIAWAS